MAHPHAFVDSHNTQDMASTHEWYWYPRLMSKQPRLTATEEQALFARLAQDDVEARHTLIITNIPLVLSMAQRQHVADRDKLDLLQEGVIGLMTAVERFDPSLGFRFGTYAIWWIMQAMSRYMHKSSRLIHIPVYISEKLALLSYLLTQYEDVLVHEEVAERLHVSHETLEQLLALTQRASTQPLLSLDFSVTAEQPPLRDDVESDAPAVDVQAQHSFLEEEIRRLLKFLTPLEREVIIRRYELLDHPDYQPQLKHIAHQLGKTPARIRQIEKKALAKLRQHSSHLYDLLEA